MEPSRIHPGTDDVRVRVGEVDARYQSTHDAMAAGTRSRLGGLSARLDFETRVSRESLSPPRDGCKPILLGAHSDSCQPIESRVQVRRPIGTVLVKCRHSMSIVTKVYGSRAMWMSWKRLRRTTMAASPRASPRSRPWRRALWNRAPRDGAPAMSFVRDARDGHDANANFGTHPRGTAVCIGAMWSRAPLRPRGTARATSARAVTGAATEPPQRRQVPSPSRCRSRATDGREQRSATDGHTLLAPVAYSGHCFVSPAQRHRPGTKP
jgi:hypothetical protein